MGIVKYKNVAMLLSTLGINTTSTEYHTSALSNEVYKFVLAQGAQKLSGKVEM